MSKNKKQKIYIKSLLYSRVDSLLQFVETYSFMVHKQYKKGGIKMDLPGLVDNVEAIIKLAVYGVVGLFILGVVGVFVYAFNSLP